MGQREAVRVNVLLESIEPATVRQLEEAGLHITELLKEIGVVTGSVSKSDVPRLRHVPGVTAVEISRKIETAREVQGLQPWR